MVSLSSIVVSCRGHWQLLCKAFLDLDGYLVLQFLSFLSVCKISHPQPDSSGSFLTTMLCVCFSEILPILWIIFSTGCMHFQYCCLGQLRALRENQFWLSFNPEFSLLCTQATLNEGQGHTKWYLYIAFSDDHCHALLKRNLSVLDSIWC